MRAAVVISTYNRADYLRELMECLDAQTRRDFELVIVDNGSTDETASLGLATLRLDANRGPGGGRNAGVAASRAPLVVITDDDCLPTPTWLERLLSAFDDPDVVVAQGRVDPDPATVDQMGPFDHTITVRGSTPFFETANVAYRRDAFDRAGGFDEHDPVLHPASGRAFGEDALLGAAVLAGGGTRVFVADAVVHHRCVPRTFAQHLADVRQLRLFPALMRRTPLLRPGLFLNGTTALFDLAVVGVVASIALRQPLLMVNTLPWFVRRFRTTWWVRGDLRVFVKFAVSDAVTFWSLLTGSAKYRRVLL
jgi:glycosyltransferase involved in cell wall biosynthesis